MAHTCHGVTYEIVNVVAYSKFPPVALSEAQALMANPGDADWNTASNSLIIRSRSLPAEGMLSSTGAFLIRGAKTREHAHTLSRLVWDTLYSDHESSFPGIDVKNLVATADLRQGINLEALAMGLGWWMLSTNPRSSPA